MRYDKNTRRKAKEKNIKALALTVVVLIGATLASAFFSLETDLKVPLPSPFRSLFDNTEFDEFSNANYSGLGTAVARNALHAHIPTEPWSFSLTPEELESRSSRIAEILKRDKKFLITQEKTLPLMRIREALSPRSQVFSQRLGIVLLPGETIRFSASSFAAQNPTLVARCLGVTPDRKDAPTIFGVATDEGSAQQVSISPRGETQEFEAKRNSMTDALTIQWPSSAPGALVIFGETAPHNKALPGIFFVSIDNLQAGLSPLASTQKVLRDHNLSHDTQFPMWPTSSNAITAISGAFTGQSPSALGLTAPASAFEISNPFAAPETLESRLSQKGYRTIRIKIGPSNICAECESSPILNSLVSQSNFDLSISAIRNHEVRQTLLKLFHDFDGDLSGLFIHVSLELPAGQFRYTWRSALSPAGSPLTWVKSAWFGDNDEGSTAHREKEIQVDQALAAVFSKMKNLGQQRVVVLATTTNSPLPSNEKVPAPPGEAWLPTSMMAQTKSPTVSQTTLFHAIPDFSAPHVLGGSVAAIQTPSEEVFVAPAGWMSLPIPTSSHMSTPAPLRSHIPFASMEATQVAIQKHRENSSVQAIHLLVPGINALPGFRAEITTPFRILTCDSSHPDSSAQIKVSGENQNVLSVTAKPQADLAFWQLTCLIAHTHPDSDKHFNKDITTLRFVTGETPIAPGAVAIGEYGLSGTLFSKSSDTNTLSIQNSHIFLPALIAPQFRPPYTKQVYFWLERYPAMPKPQGRRS
jgi:hypothetical protein